MDNVPEGLFQSRIAGRFLIGFFCFRGSLVRHFPFQNVNQESTSLQMESSWYALNLVRFITLAHEYCTCPAIPLYSTNGDDAVSFKLVILRIRSGDKNNVEVILRETSPS